MITQEQENAITMADRKAIVEFKAVNKKDKKLDHVRKAIINKWYAKTHGAISRTHFIHFVATESGVLDKLRDE